MKGFVALIYCGPDGNHHVSFPDFPGVAAAHATLDKSRANARWALFAHIRSLVASGDAIPEPLSMADVIADPRHQGAQNMRTRFKNATSCSLS